jgi:hypothetical protein
MNQKGANPVIILSITAVLVVLGVVGIYFFVNPEKNENKNTNVVVTDKNININQNKNLNTNQNINKSINTNSSLDETADWKTYTNDVWGFSFKYPKDWVIGCDTLPKTVSETTFVAGDLVVGINEVCRGYHKLEQRIDLQIILGDRGAWVGQNKTLTIKRNESGHYEILSEQEDKDIVLTVGEYYRAQAIEAMTTNLSKFSIQYMEAVEQGKKDTILKKVLSTFQFTE